VLRYGCRPLVPRCGSPLGLSVSRAEQRLASTYSSGMRTMPVSLPIACSLSSAELSAQREALLPGLAAHAVARSTLPRGMRFRFSATAERMRQIEAVVRREQECCPFLEFRVGLALGTSSLTLDVTGPEGTDRMLALLLEQPAAA
jgi:hypothetical protein